MVAPLLVLTAVVLAAPGGAEGACPQGGRTAVVAYAFAADNRGYRRTYGAKRPAAGAALETPVIRVLGLDAAFRSTSYAPAALAQLVVETDAKRFTLQLFRSGPELVGTRSNHELNGVPVNK